MAKQLIGVRQPCHQATALLKPGILLGAERANLHLGRASDAEAEYVDADCLRLTITTLADGAGHTLPVAALRGPRGTACDVAPQVRWKGAPRRIERCFDAAITARR